MWNSTGRILVSLDGLLTTRAVEHTYCIWVTAVRGNWSSHKTKPLLYSVQPAVLISTLGCVLFFRCLILKSHDEQTHLLFRGQFPNGFPKCRTAVAADGPFLIQLQSDYQGGWSSSCINPFLPIAVSVWCSGARLHERRHKQQHFAASVPRWVGIYAEAHKPPIIFFFLTKQPSHHLSTISMTHELLYEFQQWFFYIQHQNKAPKWSSCGPLVGLCCALIQIKCK